MPAPFGGDFVMQRLIVGMAYLCTKFEDSLNHSKVEMEDSKGWLWPLMVIGNVTI